MLRSYLGRQKGMLGLLFVAAVVFGLITFLYGIPAEPAVYAILLVAAAAAAFWAIDYCRYVRRCRAVELLLTAPEEDTMLFPETADRLEADYQQLTAAVCAGRAEIAAAQENSRRDMLDYYTLWAHQIKTPIAAMHLLLQPGADSTPEELDAELFKIEQYVEMVLSYLRLGSESNDFVLRRQPLDDILHSAVRKFARLFILKRITLDYEPAGMMVLTDAKWLGFVVEQLLANSLKYTPEGGKITICMRDGALLVADTGIGIRAEDQPRIFEKGFTGYNGREDKKATGLGLYLCSCAAAKLNVKLSVSSAAGQGTEMRVTLCTEMPEYE